MHITVACTPYLTCYLCNVPLEECKFLNQVIYFPVLPEGNFKIQPPEVIESWAPKCSAILTCKCGNLFERNVLQWEVGVADDRRLITMTILQGRHDDVEDVEQLMAQLNAELWRDMGIS